MITINRSSIVWYTVSLKLICQLTVSTLTFDSSLDQNTYYCRVVVYVLARTITCVYVCAYSVNVGTLTLHKLIGEGL